MACHCRYAGAANIVPIAMMAQTVMVSISVNPESLNRDILMAIAIPSAGGHTATDEPERKGYAKEGSVMTGRNSMTF